MSSTSSRPRVLIIGCGFGGLEAARALQGADVAITVVDRTNHHLFQPLLYQVATAGLSAPAIAAPVRHLFRRQANVTTLLGEVEANARYFQRAIPADFWLELRALGLIEASAPLPIGMNS